MEGLNQNFLMHTNRGIRDRQTSSAYVAEEEVAANWQTKIESTYTACPPSRIG